MIFNKTNLQKLKPRKGRYIVMADGKKYFGIKVIQGGVKYYLVRLTFEGRRIEHKITNYISGDADEVSNAYERAKEVIRLYLDGVDVKAREKAKKLQHKTLGDCVDEYLKAVKTGTVQSVITAKRTWKKAGWLNKPLKNITPDMVLKLYDKRVKDSFHSARREVAYLRAIWNKNRKHLQLPETPTRIISEERKGWSQKTTNTRRLDNTTAPKWYRALDKLSYRDRNLFLLVYYTGMRSGEVMRLEWSNINLEEKTLHLEDTKNGKDLDIPLNSYAMQIIHAINNDEYRHDKYLFPQVSRTTGKITAMIHCGKAVTKLKKEGVCWSPHDSRRGFIVAGAVLLLPDKMIRQLTNHAENKADAHDGYLTFTAEELRPASEKIGQYLYAQLKIDNVVPFRKTA